MRFQAAHVQMYRGSYRRPLTNAAKKTSNSTTTIHLQDLDKLDWMSSPARLSPLFLTLGQHLGIRVLSIQRFPRASIVSVSTHETTDLRMQINNHLD